MALLATESDILIEGFLEYPYADYQDVSTSTGGTGYTSLATAGVLEQNATAEPGDFITGARNRDSTSITVAIKPANSP
jgi:hypothetical protein